MIRSKIFRKHFLIFAAVILISVAIGLSMNLLLRNLEEQSRVPPRPPIFFAKLIDELDPLQKIAGLSKINQLSEEEIPFAFSILDEKGTLLYPTGGMPETGLKWDSLKKPRLPYEFIEIPPQMNSIPSPEPMRFPPNVLVRLKGEPAQYLLVKLKSLDRGTPPFKFLLFSIGLLALSVLVGVGISLAILYNSIAKKVTLADRVISELKNGNLKTRFPITKNDEFGQAMTRFNQMAEEIEHLVERLKYAERSRMTLLQDLAHDLRTPIASLKNLLETFDQKREVLTSELKREMTSLALKEIHYFERLVEDLLVLAQVSEPRYQKRNSEINLSVLLTEELDGIQAKYNDSPIRTQITSALLDSKYEILGDEILIRRMMRNVLDNAFSFAKTEVILTLKSDENGTSLLIKDDGKGFTSHELASYGTRRVSRYLGSDETKRLSVGLGSVIIKTITEAHHGKVSVRNRYSDHGIVIGAAVSIFLPR